MITYLKCTIVLFFFLWSLLSKAQVDTELTPFSLKGLSISGDTYACEGDSVTLSATGSFAYYKWYGEAKLDSVLSEDQELIVTKSGQYWVIAINSDTTCILSDTIKVNFSAPVFSLGTDREICVYDDYTVVPDFDNDVDSVDVSYEWSDGSAESVFTFVPPAADTTVIVDLTVTNTSGCSYTDSLYLTVSPEVDIEFNLNSTSASLCYGSRLRNTTSLYDYKWTFESLSGTVLSTGSSVAVYNSGRYYLIATNASGCTDTTSIYVTVNPLPEITLNDSVLCYGVTYTSPSVRDSYSCNWETVKSGISSDSSSISLLETDSLYVTLTDKETGCSSNYNAYLYFREEHVIDSINVSLCVYSDYTFTASSDIIGDYSWSFKGKDLNNSTSTLTLENILASEAGTYTVSGVDENGCSVSQDFVLTIVVGADIGLSSDKEICEGDSVLLSTSVSAESYNWYFNDNPEVIQSGTVVSNSKSLYADESGTYYVKVESTANGCSNVDSVEVTVNSLPDVDIPDVAKQCQGTSYLYDAGEGFTSYLWKDGSNKQTYTATSPQTVKVTVTDENGCSNSDATEFEWKEVNVMGKDAIIVCPGTDCKIKLKSYFPNTSWYFNNGVTTSNLNNSNWYYYLADIDSLDAGDYIVRVEDDGCMVYDTTSLYVVNSSSINLGKDRTVCSGETLQLNVDDGVVSYEWYLNDDLINVVSDESSVTVGSLSNGASETWILIAEYDDGTNTCSLTSSVTVEKKQKPELIVQDQIKPCWGDTVYVSDLITDVSSNSDDSDNIGYFWNGSGESTSLENIYITKSGTYSLTISNTNTTIDGGILYCYSSKNIEANYSTLFTIPDLSDQLLCAEDSITLVAPESVTGYDELKEYQWFYIDDKGNAVDSSSVNSSWEDISTAGNYVLNMYYTDSLCLSSDTLAVVAKDLPDVSIYGDTILCDGDITTLRTDYGDQSYLWSTGETSANINVSEAGDYILTIIGRNSCKNSDTTTVIVNELPIVTLNDTILGLCYNSKVQVAVANVGYSDGSTCVNPSYEWNTWETTSSIVVSSAQDYSVYVTDANSCSNSDTATVFSFPKTTIDLSSISTGACYYDGVLLECPFDISDITSYQWTKKGGSDETPVQNMDWTVFESGTYILSVADTNMCEVSNSIAIKIYTPEVELGDDITICIDSTFQLDGTDDFSTYLWSTGDTTSIITIPVSGKNEYWLLVTDNHACSASDTVIVTTEQKPYVTLPQPDTVCYGTAVELIPEISQTTSYSLLWSTGTDSEIATVYGGIYSLIVTDDENGCSDTAAIIVNSYEIPDVSLGDSMYICPLIDTVYISPEEGDVFSSYLWQNGDTTYEIVADIGETNTITVTDENGCANSDSVFVQYLSYQDTTFNYVMCQQDLTLSLLDIDADADNHTGEYYWYSDSSTNDYYTFTSSDTVCVSIGITIDDGETTCYYKQDTVIVDFYPLPVIAALDTTFYQQVTIEVDDGSPPYSYSMDSIIWQDDNTFENVGGEDEYTVYVLDSNNCSTSKTFSLDDDLGIVTPMFFTPNGDGYNDTWNIEGIERFPNSVIRIYDRYGKLMGIYKATDDGWDGTYHNKLVPATDYWYVIVLNPTNKVLRGHFNLKR